MISLHDIDDWERRPPQPDDELTEAAEIWQNQIDRWKELVIDRADPEQPANWTLLLPDGTQLFFFSEETARDTAGLYMRTGSI